MQYEPRFSSALAGLTGIVLIAELGSLAGCSAQPARHHSMASAALTAKNGSSAKPAGRADNETEGTAQNVSISEVQLVPPGIVHMLETRATLLGPHPGEAPIRLTVGMKLRNAAALKQFNADVSNPASPNYRHYLTPAEFTARYGPSRKDVAKVTDWLKSQDIRVLDVSSNRLLIHTEAPTKTYEKALGIRINDYRMDGRTFYSTTDQATLPSAIAARITGILGLNNGVRLRPLSHGKKLESPTQLRPQNAPSPASTDHSNPR